jgi:carbon monoxide dehydrogenase subunit G
MTNYKSTLITVQKTQLEVFNFLSDYNNFGKLMPEQVTNWQSTDTECSFTIQGMASLQMKIVERRANDLISMESFGKTPIKFTLFVNIEAVNDQSCTALVSIDADINPMLKMMLDKPLSNLVEKLANKIPQEVKF